MVQSSYKCMPIHRWSTETLNDAILLQLHVISSLRTFPPTGHASTGRATAVSVNDRADPARSGATTAGVALEDGAMRPRAQGATAAAVAPLAVVVVAAAGSWFCISCCVRVCAHWEGERGLCRCCMHVNDMISVFVLSTVVRLSIMYLLTISLPPHAVPQLQLVPAGAQGPARRACPLRRPAEWYQL